MSLRTVRAALTLLLVIPGTLQAQTGVNLITNPGGEDGPGDPGGYTVVTGMPSWARTGSFNVVRYGAPDFPNNSSAGPPERGLNFLAGGPSSQYATASQDVSIASLAAQIDAEELTAALSAWLGGYSSQGDNAVVRADFLDSGGNSLGVLSIGPVSNADRGNVTAMLFRDSSAAVPPLTRTIRVTIQMTRLAGSYNDGYADELALVVSDSGAVPRYFTRARDLGRPVAWTARNAVLFSLAGRVSESGPDWFTMDDASGQVARVLAQGHNHAAGTLLLVTGRLAAQVPTLTLDSAPGSILPLP